MKKRFFEITFRCDGFLTNDPTMSSDEARQKLSLPLVEPGAQLYLHEIDVGPGDAEGPTPVQPLESEVNPGEILEGGGTQWQANRDLPLKHPFGIPVAPPEVD